MGNAVSRKWVYIFIAFQFVSVACHKNLPATPAATPPASPPPVLAPGISITVDRPAITAGQSAILSWRAANANSVTIDNGLGTMPTEGSRQVSPQTSVTYVARASGPGGTTSAEVRLAVNSPVAAARPVPPPVTLTPNRTPALSDQFRDTMSNILFDYDKSNIRDNEIPKLQSSAAWLKRNPSVRFTIEGHADERGGQEYNIALGDERAAAVKDYLRGQGVEEARMIAVSYGEERPVCRQETENCWQMNRRAGFEMRP